MFTLDQKVNVVCTDTEKSVTGKIVHIRPDGFDAMMGDMVIHFYRHKPHVYIGNKAGMEFVVKTQ